MGISARLSAFVSYGKVNEQVACVVSRGKCQWGTAGAAPGSTGLHRACYSLSSKLANIIKSLPCLLSVPAVGFVCLSEAVWV